MNGQPGIMLLNGKDPVVSSALTLVAPSFRPPLDPDFRPAVLANRTFRREAREAGAAVPLVIALERSDGAVSRFDTLAFAADHPRAAANLLYAERLVKFLLWARGGWKVTIGGPASIANHIRRVYSPAGLRAFDYQFMGETVYQQPFIVVACAAEDAPPAREAGQSLGRHLDGCRIGFDLGASDLKVSAVIDGQPVWSDEIVWEPVEQTDPTYHYERIVAALRLAQSKLPRLDAIGGSSAGVYVDNRPMVASLFRGIPANRYDEIRSMFLRIRDEFGVPLEVINDGDVTALAGAMSLDDDGVLGIAMGSSEAVGYVNREGAVTGWLNELAFAPVDYSPSAPVDEWSGDRGVGSSIQKKITPGTPVSATPERAREGMVSRKARSRGASVDIRTSGARVRYCGDSLLNHKRHDWERLEPVELREWWARDSPRTSAVRTVMVALPRRPRVHAPRPPRSSRSANLRRRPGG